MGSFKLAVVLCLALGASKGASSALKDGEDASKYKLPDGFLIGGGTSAYQTEGSWDVDGKGVNVFDHYYHTKGALVNATGDIACDSYNRWQEDIDLAAEVGFNVFRLSFSWSRIFPNGRRDKVNQQGVDHYHKVIDYLRSKGIEPLITIFHFDYPQALEEEFGGWLGEKMVDVFADYADFLFKEYGPKIKYWQSINEGSKYCELAGDWFPPFTVTTRSTIATCIYHTILAHASAYKIYEDKYRETQNGVIGYGVGPIYAHPATDSPEDFAKAEYMNRAWGIGLLLNPLVFGQWPPEAPAEFKRFTPEQSKLLRGRVDFVGVNIYTAQMASAAEGPASDFAPEHVPGQPHGSSNTERAWVMREMPKWVNTRYNNLPVFITENGVSSGLTQDDWNTRAVYCSALLRELVAGVHENNNHVLGYTLWSLLDNFEFPSYEEGWGLIHVDFENGSLNRTLKKSAEFFKEVMKTKSVPIVLSSSADSIRSSIMAAVGILFVLFR